MFCYRFSFRLLLVVCGLSYSDDAIYGNEGLEGMYGGRTVFKFVMSINPYLLLLFGSLKGVPVPI